MIDYGTHQILHRQRQRDLIAESRHAELVDLARGEQRQIRPSIGASVIGVLRHAPRRAPRSMPDITPLPDPCLQPACD